MSQRMSWSKVTTVAWSHRTKILGFAQITLAQMGTWHFLSPVTISVMTTVNGLLTVWVGFINSRQNEPPK